MELIIVLAIIAIIGAVVLPNFIGTTDKARVKSDIQSARVIQNAIEMYNAENAEPLTVDSVLSDDSEAVADLQEGGYLNGETIKPQTPKATWSYDSGKVKLNVGACDDSIQEICENLSDQEKAFVDEPST